MSEERALRARVLMAKSTGDPGKVAEALCDLAACQAGIEEWEEAHESLNDADFVLLGQAPSAVHVRVLRSRAQIFEASGRADFAASFREKADQLEASL